jgi:short-subunit dehydrogenase
MATYAATKAFVLSFSEGIAGELAGTGVKILAFCPGPVRTEFQSVAKNEKAYVPSFVYEDAKTVVARAIAAAAGGRTVFISGGLNFTMAQLTRIAPRALISRVARRIYRPADGA